MQIITLWQKILYYLKGAFKLMTKFTTGLIAGGIIGAIGLTCALSDKKTRQKLVHNGKKMINRAEDVMDMVD